MIPPTPSVPSCPLLDAKIVEVGARAIHSGKGCTCRRGAKGDAVDVLTAAVAALDRDALAVLIEDAIRDESDACDGWPTIAQLALAVLAAIGLLPAEERQETP